MSGVSRRDFLKVAGTSAGAVVASSYNRRSYAANERIRVGVIGTGGQGCKHIEYGIAGTPQLQLASLCDVYRPHREFALRLIDANYEDKEKLALSVYAGDYREMLDKEQLDAVLICTPSDLHHGMVTESLDRGLAVFCEKPLALTVKDAREIVQKCHDTGGFCQIGHQRRYNPVYNKAVWYARRTQHIGRINHITAQWHRNDDWLRYVDAKHTLDETESRFISNVDEHLNWRVYGQRSGGLMMELGTHQVDVATWFLGAPPSRVMGCGGIDYWFDGRDTDDNVSVIFEYDIPSSAASFYASPPRTEHHDPRKLMEPYRARFEYSMHLSNERRGISELVQGDHGSLQLSEKDGGRLFGEWAPTVDYKRMNAPKNPPTTISVSSPEPDELFLGGVPIHILMDTDKNCLMNLNARQLDGLQFQSFARDMSQGNTPKASAYVGLQAVVAGVAANRAVRKRRMVEIKPELLQFDFQQPDPYRYDDFPSPQVEDSFPRLFPRPLGSGGR